MRIVASFLLFGCFCVVGSSLVLGWFVVLFVVCVVVQSQNSPAEREF
jgi:hypothetical protein